MKTRESIKLKPLREKIIIKGIPNEEVLAGGIMLPTNTEEKPTRGIVVARGEGVSIEVGAKVLFPKWGGDIIKFEGEEYLILRERDLIATFE